MSSQTTMKKKSKTTLEKNLANKVVPFAEEHPDSTEAHFLNLLRAGMAKAHIRKIKTLEDDFDEKPYSTKKIENDCANCQTGIKYMRKIKLFVNGKPLQHGETGHLVGEDCFNNITALIAGINDPDYQSREMDEYQRKEERNRVAPAKMSLDQLSKKIVRILEKEGYNLKDRVRADVANDIQKQLVRGDFTGLDKEIDPARTLDVLDWLIGYANKIKDKDIRRKVAYLASDPKRLTSDDLHDLVLYEWQTRFWSTSGELGGVKEDIHYLAELTKKNPENKVIRRYGTVSLDTQLTPIKVYERAEWEDLTLRDVLGDTPAEKKTKKKKDTVEGRTAVTKAQARSVRTAAPYLRERRIFHNRELMKHYAEKNEWSRLLENLENKYNSEKQAFAKQKAEGKKEPVGNWESTYKKLAGFFNLKEEIYQTRARPSLRQILMGYVFMQDAQKNAKQLYVEGRKLELAEKTGNAVLRESYMPLRDAGIQDAEAKIDKLVNGVIEFDKMPLRTSRRLKKAGISRNTLKAIVEDVRKTHEFDLVKTAYGQSGTKTSQLARALEVTADYTPIDAETAAKLDRMRKLTEHNIIQLRFESYDKNGKRAGSVSLEDGKGTESKKAAAFNPAIFEGKKYISKEQKAVIDKVYNCLWELREIDLKEVENLAEKVAGFYKQFNVYTSPRFKVGFEPERIPGPEGRFYRHCKPRTLRDLMAEMQPILEGKESKHYQRVSDELRVKINELRSDKGRRYVENIPNQINIPANIDQILADPRTLLRDTAVEGVNRMHGYFKNQEASVARNRDYLKSKGFDVTELASQAEELQKKGMEITVPNMYFQGLTVKSVEIIKNLKDDLMVLEEKYVKSISDKIKNMS